jgi:amino-acid N-acetyltransferase
MNVRRAALPDVPSIAELVNLGVREGQLLPRSVDAIRASIGDWVVVEDGGRIVGCGSLLAMGPALGEVRSLAVAPEYRKNGVGARIVDALVAEAQTRGMPVVFALTRAVSFFQRMGFTVTARENFPEKVWRDCMICPVRLACDETAVVKLLNSSTKNTKEHE